MTDAGVADPLTALGRLEELVPRGLELAASVDGLVWGRAELRGVPAVVFATEPKVQGGALGGAACRAVAAATRIGLAEDRAVVGLWHSGGARLQEGVGSLDGMGEMFAAKTAASGRVPQVAVVLGPAAGGAAYGPALSDLVITAPSARLFVTGPDVVRQVTGEDVDAVGLGGPEPHSQESGLVHLVADARTTAYDAAHCAVALLHRPTGASVPVTEEPRLRTALPERSQEAYDVRPLVALLLDSDTRSLELHARWAPNILTTLGRLGGQTVGVLANNPVWLAGCLDARASDKAARFVRMCDALGIPLVVIVDTPGYLPGVAEEHGGIVRRGAKLLHAFAEARVPWVTVVTHKAYGGAYIAMGSRSLGATSVLAWPGARIGVMGPEAAAQVVHRRTLAALPEPLRAPTVARLAEDFRGQDDVARALECGVVDAVIDPAATRNELAARLGAAPVDRGRHGNIPL